MNSLLKHYAIDVEFPEVSGAEQVEMLQIRDKLFDLEPTLSTEERESLLEADRRLAVQAASFHAELSKFIDFEARRRTEQPPAARWWWYLDVLAQMANLWSQVQQEASLAEPVMVRESPEDYSSK
ncbi:MAG: hypothetical protein KDF65_00465 [Anaerolineae bacterium]|nr:hypothetical protein [Anaerolineae bacterium]